MDPWDYYPPDLSKSPAQTEQNIFHMCYEHTYQTISLLDTSEVVQWYIVLRDGYPQDSKRPGLIVKG